MGQAEVMKTLNESGDWLTCKEISERLGINRANISRALSKLKCYEVETRVVSKLAANNHLMSVPEWKIVKDG